MPPAGRAARPPRGSRPASNEASIRRRCRECELAAYACGECKSGIIRTVRTFKERGNAVSNANVPLLFFSNFFLPTISNYSTRLNSAQLTNSSQLSSSYQPSNSTLVTNSSRLSSTNSQDYHLPHNKSGRGGREIFLVVAGSRLVVLDGCCALRASPSGSTQRGTAPRPFAPTFPATLRRHRRRPFAVNVRIPLDLQCHHFVNSFSTESEA